MPTVEKDSPMRIPTVEDIECALKWRPLDAEIEQLRHALYASGRRPTIYQVSAVHLQVNHLERPALEDLWPRNALKLWWEQIQARQAQSPEEMVAAIHETVSASEYEPIHLKWSTWVFKGDRYDINGKYSLEQQKLLILETVDAERRKFERLKLKFSGATGGTEPGRPRIPESVRIEVWRRDGGQCVRCGSRENLEYDHIVPVSRGGSNTARNIELLCESCNRSKGAQIG
jgi:hypothetical protein